MRIKRSFDPNWSRQFGHNRETPHRYFSRYTTNCLDIPPLLDRLNGEAHAKVLMAVGRGRYDLLREQAEFLGWRVRTGQWDRGKDTVRKYLDWKRAGGTLADFDQPDPPPRGRFLERVRALVARATA